MEIEPGFTLAEWRRAYRQDALAPQDAIPRLAATLATDDTAWILRLPAEALQQQLDALKARLAQHRGDFAQLPLYGIPFAVKDNLDVAGLPTTAACPQFSYLAQQTAPAIQKLLDAGAILIGKTNLDQFATGLVGVRSPYGAVTNSFDPRYISGGSSSGSASVVARGLVPFALGTDTAGSGRVPAGFNNIVGLKPTRGALSSRGMVPACRTLDCVSVFAMTVEDAEQVYRIAAGYDADDAYSRPAPITAATARLPARPRLGIPAAPDWFGDTQSQAAWRRALQQFESLGAQLVEVDFTPLHDTAALLYSGPWVAERYAALEDFLREQPEAMHLVVRNIVLGARGFSAVDAFKAEYRRAALKRRADALIGQVDALLVPTAPSIYTIAEVEADPVALNSRLGTWTNFVNLLDWSAVALPAGFREDGLPFGITLIAPAWGELSLSAFGRRWQRHAPGPLGATRRLQPPVEIAAPQPPPDAGVVRLAVVGAHLSGMPLNRELRDRAAVLVETTTTSSRYRLYAVPGTVPPKPGLVRTGEGGAIEVELWDLPVEHFGSFVAGVVAPLAIGTLELADGRRVQGFLCETWATLGATDITAFGGWRAYLAAQT